MFNVCGKRMKRNIIVQWLNLKSYQLEISKEESSQKCIFDNFKKERILESRKNQLTGSDSNETIA